MSVLTQAQIDQMLYEQDSVVQPYQPICDLLDTIAALQSQLAEERAGLLTALRILIEDKPGAALNAVQEDYKDLVELVGQERAKRGELIERAKQAVCGYCNPERLLNLLGHFDESGKNHVDSSGCTYPCKAYPLRNLDPSASQAFDAMQQQLKLASSVSKHLFERLDAMQQREQKLRELLWLNHAQYLPYVHTPYGDDGEMQCCGVDFKRMSVEDMEHVITNRRAALAESAKEACGHTWSAGDKAWGCVLPAGHSGDHSAFAQPPAGGGTQ